MTDKEAAPEPSRWNRATLGLSVGLIALILVAGVIVVIVTALDDEDAPSPPDGREPTSTASDGADTSEPGFVTLPSPKGLDERGYPVDYPATPEGAVAYALASGVATTTYDYGTMEGALRSYVHSPADYAQLAGEAVASSREAAGVPVSGDAPQGYSSVFVPEGARWDERSPSEIAVWATGKFQFTNPDGAVTEVEVAVPLGVIERREGRWWKFVEDDMPGEGGEYSAPGTPAFEAAGWRVIQNDDWKGPLP